MNKIYALVLILMTTVSGWSQTRTWNGGNGSWNDASKWTPMGVPSSADRIEFIDISATVSNVPDLNCRELFVSGASIILNGRDGANRTLTTGDGSMSTVLTIAAGAVLTIGNNLDIAVGNNGRAFIDGTLIITRDRQFLANAGEFANTIVDGVIRNEGGVVNSTDQTLGFRDGSRYEHAGDSGSIPYATWSQQSTCAIEGISAKAPGGLDQVFGNYRWSCGLQTAGTALGIVFPSQVRGNLIVDKAGANPSVSLLLPAKTTIAGDLVLADGVYTGKEANTLIEVGGNLELRNSQLRAGTASASASLTVQFRGRRKQSVVKTNSVVKGVKFLVDDESVLDLGENVLDGDADFTLAPGATLILAHKGGIATEGASGAIQVNGKRNFSTEAHYIFSGKKQQITGAGLPSTVASLVIDNTAGVTPDGGVILTKAVAVTSELVLRNGFLQTSSEKMLTLLDDAVATTVEQAFVAGPIQKKGKSPFTFPTGWSGPGGGQIPIGFDSLSEVATIQAEYKRSSAVNQGTRINAPLHHISYCEYWELFPVKGSVKTNISMYRNGHSNCNPESYVEDFASVRVARSNGIAWTEIGNSYDSLVDGNGVVVSDEALIDISSKEKYYALGHITTANDPLPVLFDNVIAYEKNDGVNVEWSNLTERDIAIYYVERSFNGMDYTIIGQYLPESNRDDKASYLHFDHERAGGEVFYRIKAIGKNTKIIFSKVMRIDGAVAIRKNLNFYPNPVTQHQFALSLANLKEGSYPFQITTITGQVIYKNVLVNQGSFTTQTFKLPASIKAGIYNLTITGSDYYENRMFIVQ